MLLRLALSLWIVLAWALAGPTARSQPADLAGEEELGPVPPRLSWLDGDVTLERGGSAEAQPAVVNMPLAPGDLLRSGARSSFELQIGPKAFARGWSNTTLVLQRRERDGLAFDLLEGDLTLDIRQTAAQAGIQIFAGGLSTVIRQAGYYRVMAAPEKIVLQVRRGGQAALTLADGGRLEVISDREFTLDPRPGGSFATVPVPASDAWDDWNIARTDDLVRSESERYVASDLYGTRELDRHGYWRQVPEYGPVWTPYHVPSGWIPYSTGFWVHDPYYGWTWVDTQPWGWAPFHYGRWVRVHGSWCWAPGPRIVRPVYAPALVVFAASPSGSFLFSLNGPPQAWVALGWGEPCVPWWGRPEFRRPWWGGWGGPRVVNHVVVKQTTVVHVHQLRSFEHARIHHAVVKAREDHFPRRRYDHGRFVAGHDAGGRHSTGVVDRSERPMRVVGEEPNRYSVRETRRPQREEVRPKEVRTPISEAKQASPDRPAPMAPWEPGTVRRFQPEASVNPRRTPVTMPQERAREPRRDLQRELRTPISEAERASQDRPAPASRWEPGTVRRFQPEASVNPRRTPVTMPQERAREPRRDLQLELRTPISEAERASQDRPAPASRWEPVPSPRPQPLPGFHRQPARDPRIQSESPAGPRRTPVTMPQERAREPRRYLQREAAPTASPPAVSTLRGEQPRIGWHSPGPVRTPPSGAFSSREAGAEAVRRIPSRRKGWD